MYGGVETALAALWRERGACPALAPEFALCFEGRLSRELREEGAAVHHLGAVRARSPLSVRRARRMLARLLGGGRYDAAICHAPWAQAVFAPAARAAAVAQVFWMHAPSAGRHWLERWARRHAPDLVVCNSRFTAASAPLLYPRAPAEVVRCPLTKMPGRLSPAERAAVRAELDTPAGATVVIQAGRMESLKGQAEHLEALGRLRDVEGWVCWQVGGAQQPSEVRHVELLKRSAVRLGIAGRVRFTGERADVARLLGAADIYCQPNVRPDAFGLTFVEALVAGLPVVTTAFGGALEVVDDSCGVLVPPGDRSALASALRALIDGTELRAELGARGPRRASALCDPSAQMQRLHGLLGRLAGREVAA
jgi:glycosyltransferase involved in cell wall biosynthesis